MNSSTLHMYLLNCCFLVPVLFLWHCLITKNLFNLFIIKKEMKYKHENKNKWRAAAYVNVCTCVVQQFTSSCLGDSAVCMPRQWL